jgi:hypothetical protein
VDFDSALSYGEAFNIDAGGYFVTSRSRDCGIQIWFWPRYSPDVPAEIAQGGVEALSPDPTWGEPVATFPMEPGFCDYDQYFNEHEIIFDLTFCVGDLSFASYCFLTTTEVLASLQGDWAGNDWDNSICGIQGACEDCKYPVLARAGRLMNSSSPISVVNDNPSAFREAYWEINSLRVYTPGQY